MLITCKILDPDRLRHIHQSHIAGICDRIFDRLLPMSGTKMTINIIIAYMFVPSAHISFISRKRSCFQTGCHRKRLRRRSRFKGIAHAEISPQRVHRFQLLFFRHRFPFFFRIQRGQIPRIVQVKIRIGCLRQNFSAVRIHNDHCRIFTAGLSLPHFSGMSLIKF